MSEGFVYAIRSGDFVKIGWAADPVRRLSELNVGSPHDHELVGFARGTKDHERQMHELCSEQRVRGEWFRQEGPVEIFLSMIPKVRGRQDNYRSNSPSSGMTLDEYIRRSRVTESEIARQAGCSQSTVNKVRNGTLNPTFGLLQRIFEATVGGMEHPLRKFRKEASITLDALAKEVGVTKGFLSKVEKRKQVPSLSVVERIVNATNGALRADDFLSGDNLRQQEATP